MSGIQENKRCGHSPSKLYDCSNIDKDLYFSVGFVLREI